MLLKMRVFTMKIIPALTESKTPLRIYFRQKGSYREFSYLKSPQFSPVDINSWSSAPSSDAMFLSSHCQPSSEEDEDSEPDTNPLLMNNSEFDSQKYHRSIGSYASTTLDHGYHSMETLNNDSAKLGGSWLKNDNGFHKMFNNNQVYSDVLWHDSAWSAPQKSSNSKISVPRDSWFNLQGYHPWTSNTLDSSKSHLYVNELDSGIEDSLDSVWSKSRNVLGIDHGQAKIRSKKLDESKLNLMTKSYQFNEVKIDNSERIATTPSVKSPSDEKTSANQSTVSRDNLAKRPQLSPLPSNEGDVNLVSRNFNNFSISSSKQREILRLLQEKRKTEIEANIVQPRNESKILNTGKNVLRSTSVTRHGRRLIRPHCTSMGIAEGLVLEKVRYDPNWRRQNSALCSSEDAVKQFCPEVNVKGPLSVPIEPTTRTLDQEETFEQTEESTNTTKKDIESPTENVTPSVVGVEKLTVDSRKNETSSADELLGDIESTMPTIDWVAMEAHLIRAAQEDLWSARRHTDREEIRRRLALGPDADEYYLCDSQRFQKKPNLTTRLQNGMNLQICFMNETASDSDNDDESENTQPSPETKSLLSSPSSLNNNSCEVISSSPDCSRMTPPSSPVGSESSQSSENRRQRPSFFFAKQRSWRLRARHKHESPSKEQITAAKEVGDFYSRHARLQAEARFALSQAKEMARMQMQVERQNTKKSPISDIVGLSFQDRDEFPLCRQTLTTMNLAQLQVVANDLHSQIEKLNDDLVRLLLNRDDLNMEQDSMLVDIEDLTRYLGAKDFGDNSDAKSLTTK